MPQLAMGRKHLHIDCRLGLPFEGSVIGQRRRHRNGEAQSTIEGPACGRRPAGCGGVRAGRGGIGGAGAANATCASISGVSAGAGCTSTPTSFAIGLGPGTEVNAQGLFNGAIAVGTETEASATGVGNLAVAVGNPGVNGQVMAVVPTDAIATGTFNRAFAFGNGSGAAAQRRLAPTTRRLSQATAVTPSRPAASPHHLRPARTTLRSHWVTSAAPRLLATTNSPAHSATTRQS
jgi:hypothetical protein